MAIVILDTQQLTESGNITIPENCTRIHALVFGSEFPPTINGAAMAKIHGVPSNSKVVAISAHEYIVSEDDVSVPFVISGTQVTLYFTSGADTYRPDILLGNATSGTLSGILPTTANDLALGILAGMIGACTIKGDTVEFTYDRNDTYLKTGHIVPSDTSLDCELKDVGVSAGYWIDGGSIDHPAELISEGYYSFDPVYHWVTFEYAGYYPATRTYYFKQYDNGVYIKTVSSSSSSMSPYGYYAYPGVWHPPVYSDAWTEYLPDTWVEGGEQAQVNGLVVIIKTGEAMDFVPKVVIGQ